MGCRQSILDDLHSDYVQWCGKVLDISSRMVTVFGVGSLPFDIWRFLCISDLSHFYSSLRHSNIGPLLKIPGSNLRRLLIVITTSLFFPLAF